MTNQPITAATVTSIVLLTADLPPTALLLARVAVDHCDQLPHNVRAGLQHLLHGARDPHPIDIAMGELMDGNGDDRYWRGVLEDHGAVADSLTVMDWLRRVQLLCAADAVSMMH